MFTKYYTSSNISSDASRGRHPARTRYCQTWNCQGRIGKRKKRKDGEQKDTHEYLTYSRTRLWRQSKIRRWRRQVHERGTYGEWRGALVRPSHGPGFLEIVSGPGPLNALYVSCNLIPRRSVRCAAIGE
jgi:hypothetical protein